MSVPSSYTPKQYNCDGVTTHFTFNFPLFAASDLVVIITDSAGKNTTLTYGTNYTISPSNTLDYSNGGSIETIDQYGAAYAYPAGSKITLYRDVPATQETSFPTNGPLPARNIETGLDKATVLIQQLKEILGRTVTVVVTDQGATLEIPNAAARKNGFLSFDVNGNVFIADGAANSPVSSFMASVIAAADGKTALSTMITDATAGVVLTLLGVTTFVKTLLDDITASAFLDTLGGTTIGKQLFGAASANAAKSILGRTLVTLTSGSGIWSVPNGVTSIKVTCVGGGGAGGGLSPYGGGGGGAGGMCVAVKSVTPGASVSYSVGAAGAATTFSTLTAGAGSDGTVGSASYSGQGGAGGTCLGGDVNIPGGDGSNAPSGYAGGRGSSGPFGGGGKGANQAVAARAGAANSGGGGGGGSSSVGGAAGGSGIIIIEY